MASDLLTPDELRIIVGGLTAGDFWRFQESTGGAERTRAILEALHRSAVRKGLAESGDPQSFLDRVELQSLGTLFGGGLPLGNLPPEDTEDSPASADTGG